VHIDRYGTPEWWASPISQVRLVPWLATPQLISVKPVLDPQSDHDFGAHH
jgi:hypothetical protein